MRVNSLFYVLFIGGLIACKTRMPEKSELQLIPQPKEIHFDKGIFKLNKQVSFRTPLSEEGRKCADLLNVVVSEKAGYTLPEREDGTIVLDLDTTMVKGSQEGYRLQITSKQIRIEASTEAGLFYGVQTLTQLLADQQFYHAEKQMWTFPALRIDDTPTFPYRGLHLDVARHFFPKEYVMKWIDLIAGYKLNRLHWHLTDAGGWRIEIKSYPELTTSAAWRSEEDYMKWWKGDRRYTTQESVGAYGGYYTQEEIREIVEYAAQRQITVIPEIEMPGHSEEVLAMYPHLSCSGKPYQNGEFCIGKEETFEFVEQVLDEVLDLFPSEYIHIGGDEASTAAWKKCPLCQKRLKAEHLKDEKGLQSYMIRRVNEYLKSKGRKLLGWDEILEGGLAEDATVMSWRGEAGGIQAARMGHDVIMTPGGYCYFDSYQADPRTQPAAIGGYLPYLKVYSYHPLPEELNEKEAQHILGAQANLWTEYIRSPEYVEYMLFPRILALSEVVWTPQEKRDKDDFKRRIAWHIKWLQKKEVNVFPLSDRVDILTEVDTLGKRMKVWFDSEKFQPEIYYSINQGEELQYQQPFYVRDSAMIQAFIVENDKTSDFVSKTRIDYHRGIGRKVTYQSRYSSSYPAAGLATLTDGKRGSLTYGDGRWQGFLTNVDVVIDLDSICDLNYISAGFMQLIGPGVYMPDYVTISISEDGKTFCEVARINNKVPVDETDLVITDFTARFNAKGRYVRLFAKKHAGFQFMDEIVIY